MKRIAVKLKDFEKWLIDNHLPEFKHSSYIKEFISQGFPFLILTGSKYLKSYILELTIPKLKSLNIYLAWSLFSNCVTKIKVNHEVLEMEYDESRLRNIQKPLKREFI